MEFDEWEPVYETILADLGFERAADEHARDILAEFVDPFDCSRLDASDATVAIAGGADTLRDERAVAEAADMVFAASTAADVLDEADIPVDLLVTDLDKNPETARSFTESGIPVAAHAHGDNIPLVRERVPTFETSNVLGTTQAAPIDAVYNFGGFTDGDRAAFLADYLGASELAFPGWDFDDDTVDGMKAKKLEWAERLLYWLETRRGDSFDVLDGRRDGIEPIE